MLGALSRRECCVSVALVTSVYNALPKANGALSCRGANESYFSLLRGLSERSGQSGQSDGSAIVHMDEGAQSHLGLPRAGWLGEIDCRWG